MKSNFFKKLTALFLCSVILCMNFNFTVSAYAETQNNIFKPSQSFKGISENLKDILKSDDDFYDVMVYFNDDAEKNNHKVDESELVGVLYENALMTQEDILNWLQKEKKQGNVKEYKSFYIVNCMHLVAKKDIILQLAKNEKVQSIDCNQQFEQPKPVPVPKPKRIRRSADESEWNIKLIEADKAWDLGATGKGVTVGILDSSVDIYHPALLRKFKGYDDNTGEIVLEGNYFDSVEKKKSPKDAKDHEHGTHCMGTILGSEVDESGNQFNRIGVAPDAKFISARVFDDKGYNNVPEFLEAGEWMLAPGGDKQAKPDIINNSWGGGDYDNQEWFRKMVKAWCDAGILPVFASGNQLPYEPAPGPGSISSPASYKESFAVGAVDKYSKLAKFSKRGPSPFNDVEQNHWKPEVSAPGVLVRSSVEGGYEYMSGTSMAAPHVSGVAALIKSVNPNLTVDEMKDILSKTATPATDQEYQKSPNHGYGNGIVNAYQAVSEIKGTGNGSLEGKVVANGKPISAKISIKETNHFCKSDASDGTFILKNPAGEWTAVCSAYGYEDSTKQVKINKNGKTEINFELKEKQKANVSCKVVDQNNTPIKGVHAYLLEDNRFGTIESDETGNIKIENLPVGEYTLRVFKSGYECYEKQIVVSEKSANNNHTVILEKNNRLVEELKYDNGNPNKLFEDNFPITPTAYRSAAVLFTPSKTGGVISSVKAYFIDNKHYKNDKRVSISIKQLDKRGRLITLLEDTEFTFDNYNGYQEFSLEKYNIKTDKPYFVILSSAKNQSSFTVGMEKDTDQNNSYVYIGQNFDTVELYNNVNDVDHNLSGAFMIRAEMKYPQNAKLSNNIVAQPVVEPVRPEQLKVVGKAKPYQKIRLVVEKKLRRLYTTADKNGDFSFTMKKKIPAGFSVYCYAKDSTLLSSIPAEMIALNDTSELKQVVNACEIYLGKTIPDENLKNTLEAKKQQAQKLLEEINNYEKLNNISKEQIKQYQNNIETLVQEIKKLTIQLEPEKVVLKNKIAQLEQLKDELWVDKNSYSVPTTKFWVTDKEWDKLDDTIKLALKVYDKPAASEQEIVQAIEQLNTTESKINAMKQQGRMKLPVINSKNYKDGTFSGKFKGYSKNINKINITITDGKLKDIKFERWFEGDEVLQHILDDNYIERIISGNSLDTIPTRNYEIECRFIRNAILDALNNAKVGEGIKEKIDNLKQLISTAEFDLADVKISEDGAGLDDGIKWIDDKNYQAFRKVIEKSKLILTKTTIEEAEVNELIDEMEKAIDEFEQNIHIVNKNSDNTDDIKKQLKTHIFDAKQALYNQWEKKTNKSFVDEWIDNVYKQKYIKTVKKAEKISKNSDATAKDINEMNKKLVSIIEELMRK